MVLHLTFPILAVYSISEWKSKNNLHFWLINVALNAKILFMIVIVFLFYSQYFHQSIP